MTLPLNSRLSALYDTNGTQKDFGFGFRVFFDPDNGGYGLEVRRQTADGYDVIPKSDYLVLPVEDNSAGVVRFSVAPSAGQQIYIAGKTPTIQQLVLTNFGRYSAESIETQFDFITAIIQEWLSALGEETRQRMAADDILTQYVVQRIDDFVQQVNQNFDDKSQEIEDYIATIMPSFTQALHDEIEAFAVAGMQDAIDQTLADSKAEIDDAISLANAAALAAAITGKVYDTPVAGVDPVTGVGNGAYYSVRSPDDDSYLVEYQNIGGVPTPSGKSYPSSNALNNIPHNNLKNRDADDAHPASAISDASGKSQQAINDGIPSLSDLRLIDPKMKGRRTYLNSVIADKNLGGGTFVSTTKSSLVDNGGTVIDSANPNLMWVRVEYAVMTPEMFGCIGDGVTDDTVGMSLFAAAKYHHKVAANDYLLTATPFFNIEHDSSIIDFSKSKLIGTDFTYTALQVEVNKPIKSLNIKTGSYDGGGLVNGYIEAYSMDPSGYADLVVIECFGELKNFSNEKNTRGAFGIRCAIPSKIMKVLEPVVSDVHNKNGIPSIAGSAGVSLTNYKMLGIIENPIISNIYTSTGVDADGLVLFEQKDSPSTGTAVGVVKDAHLKQCCGRGIKSQSNIVVLGADIELSVPTTGTVIDSWRGIDAQLGGMYCKDINYSLKGAALFNALGDTALFQSSGSTTPQDQIVKGVTLRGDSNIRYFMLLASNNHKNVVIDQVQLLDPQSALNCLYVTAGISVTGSVSISNLSSGWWSNGRLFFDTTYTGSNIPKLNISNVDWDGFNTLTVSKFNKIRIVNAGVSTIQGALSYDAISEDSSFYYSVDGSVGITYSRPIPDWARRYCHYERGTVYSTFRNNVLTKFNNKFYQSLNTEPTEIV